MSGDRENIDQWYRDVVRASDDPVGVLKERLSKAADVVQRQDLFRYLISELHRFQRDQEAEVLLLELATECPGETRPLITLANHYLYFQIDPSSFESTIGKA